MGKISITDFAKLVEDMRENQKNYFKHRGDHFLHRSKELEREVDKAIKQILHENQGELFEL